MEFLLKLQAEFMELYSTPDAEGKRPHAKTRAAVQRATESFVDVVGGLGLHLEALPRDIVTGPVLERLRDVSRGGTTNGIHLDIRVKGIRKFIEFLRMKNIAVPVLDFPVIERPKADPNAPPKIPKPPKAVAPKPAVMLVPAAYSEAGAAARTAIITGAAAPSVPGLALLPPSPTESKMPDAIDPNLTTTMETGQVGVNEATPSQEPAAQNAPPMPSAQKAPIVGKPPAKPRMSMAEFQVRVWVQSNGQLVFLNTFAYELVDSFPSWDEFFRSLIDQKDANGEQYAFPLPQLNEITFYACIVDPNPKIGEGVRKKFTLINTRPSMQRALPAAQPRAPIPAQPQQQPVQQQQQGATMDVAAQIRRDIEAAVEQQRKFAAEVARLQAVAASTGAATPAPAGMAPEVAHLQEQMTNVSRTLDLLMERMDQLQQQPAEPPVSPLDLMERSFAQAERMAKSMVAPPAPTALVAPAQTPMQQMMEQANAFKVMKEVFAPEAPGMDAELADRLATIEDKLTAQPAQSPLAAFRAQAEEFAAMFGLKTADLFGGNRVSERPKTTAEVIGDVVLGVINNAEALGTAAERTVGAIAQAKMGIVPGSGGASPGSNGGKRTPQLASSIRDSIDNLLDQAATLEPGPKSAEAIMFAAVEMLQEFAKDANLAKVNEAVQKRVREAANNPAVADTKQQEIAVYLRQILVPLGFTEKAQPKVIGRIAVVMVKRAIATAEQQRRSAAARPVAPRPTITPVPQRDVIPSHARPAAVPAPDAPPLPSESPAGAHVEAPPPPEAAGEDLEDEEDPNDVEEDGPEGEDEGEDEGEEDGAETDEDGDEAASEEDDEPVDDGEPAPLAGVKG